MNQKFFSPAAALIVLLASGVAHAESEAGKFYAAAGYGLAQVSGDGAGHQSSGAGILATRNEANFNAAAWNLTLGYTFNEWLSLEGGYYNVGNFSATETLSGSFVGQAKEKLSANLWFLAPRATYHIDKLGLFVKAGVVRAEVENEITLSGGATATITNSKTQIVPMVGLGTQYDLSEHVGLRGEFVYVDKVGNSTGGDSSIRLWMVSALYRF